MQRIVDKSSVEQISKCNKYDLLRFFFFFNIYERQQCNGFTIIVTITIIVIGFFITVNTFSQCKIHIFSWENLKYDRKL